MTDAGGRRSRAWSLWLGLAAISPALLLLAQLAPWPWLPALLGRAHPVLLHFPIGLLLLVAVMEAIEMASRGRFRFGSGLALFAGTIGAVLAATCGYLLMRADAVEGSRVERHLYGGVAVAALAVIALVIQAELGQRTRGAARQVYRGVLLVLCAVLALTGHDGSVLTHGENYLTENLPWNVGKSRIAAPKFPTDKPVAQWTAYNEVVAPILEMRCVACHNSTNFKGKLVLDRWEGVARGGKTGPLWVDGNTTESLLVERLLLPLNDEKHMPPKKKPQPSAGEVALLKLWVKAGAPAQGIPPVLANDQAWLSAAKKLPNVLMAAYKLQAAPVEEFHEVDPAKVAQARVAVERVAGPLRARFPGVISYESRESTDLRVNASLLGPAFGDADLAALAPLKAWMVELDLGDTAVGDASATVLASLTRLRLLRLNGTRIGDTTVTRLAALKTLESLALFRTGVSDAGAVTLAKLPKLRRVYATETKMSANTLSSFEKALREPAITKVAN